MLLLFVSARRTISRGSPPKAPAWEATTRETATGKAAAGNPPPAETRPKAPPSRQSHLGRHRPDRHPSLLDRRPSRPAEPSTARSPPTQRNCNRQDRIASMSVLPGSEEQGERHHSKQDLTPDARRSCGGVAAAQFTASSVLSRSLSRRRLRSGSVFGRGLTFAFFKRPSADLKHSWKTGLVD